MILSLINTAAPARATESSTVASLFGRRNAALKLLAALRMRGKAAICAPGANAGAVLSLFLVALVSQALAEGIALREPIATAPSASQGQHALIAEMINRPSARGL